LVKVNADFSTNIPGFYAVGEVADSNPFRQVITAAAEGGTAADSVKKFLS
jgi:thioredoxin reductase